MHHRAPDRILRPGLRVVDTRASARPDRATRGPTDARRRASPDGRLVAQTLSYTATGSRTDGRGPRRLGSAALLTILVAVCLVAGCSAPAIGAESDRPVRILSGGAATLDPAAAGDAGSANVIGQLYETLTSFDTTLTLRPALAESWDIQDGGRRIVFKLRDGLTFSDGTPLTGDDVVRSWMRIIDPASPSPLVSLMSDVEGAMAYARGQSSDPSSVGLHADGQEVTVDLNRPAADFVTVVASPTFSVVPPGMDDDPDVTAPGSFVRAAATPSRPPTRGRRRSLPTPTTGPASRRSRRSSWSKTSKGAARSRTTKRAGSTTCRSATSMRPGSPTTGISDRISERCRRSRSSTTASTRRARRSMT